jgi:recombination protein RecT
MPKPQFHRGANQPAQRGGALTISPKDLNVFMTSQLSGELARVIPPGVPLDAQMIIGQAVNAVRNSEALQKCSLKSIGSSVMYAAQIGLELATPRGHAWLIPYKQECTYQVGYKGLGALAYRSGKIHNIKTSVIYEADVFEYVEGGGPEGGDLFRYEKNLRKDRGAWLGAFMRVIYPPNASGVRPPDYVHVMSVSEIEQIRDQSSRSAYDTGQDGWAKKPEYLKGPWKDWADEMRKKTAVKQGLKMLDLAPALNLAIGLDDQAIGNGRQDRVVEVRDWEVIDIKALPAAASAPRDNTGQPGAPPAQDQPEKTEPGPDPNWDGKVLGPLTIEKNFSPEERETLVKHISDCVKWAPDRMKKWVVPGPGNRAHVETILAHWQGDKALFIEQLKEVIEEARANYKAHKAEEKTK